MNTIMTPIVKAMGFSEKLQKLAKAGFKTLVVQDDNDKLAVAILPVEHLLKPKKIAKAIGSKSTNGRPQIGRTYHRLCARWVSPLGQKNLPTVIDRRHNNFATIYCSGGRRGLEIELSPSDLDRRSKRQVCRFNSRVKDNTMPNVIIEVSHDHLISQPDNLLASGQWYAMAVWQF